MLKAVKRAALVRGGGDEIPTVFVSSKLLGGKKYG